MVRKLLVVVSLVFRHRTLKKKKEKKKKKRKERKLILKAPRILKETFQS